MTRRASPRCARRLLLPLALLLSTPLAAQQQAPQVVVSSAVQADLAPFNWYPGAVISRNQARLAAEEEGRLIWVAEVGSRIIAGEPVARLDDTLLRQELAAARAVVTGTRARLDYLKKEVERLRSLAATNIATQSQLDQAASNVGVTQSELAASAARVAVIDERLRRTVTAAPFDGVVTERLQQAGEWAEAGETLVRLVDDAALEVQTWIPVHLLEFVAVGSVLRLKSSRHETQGEVRAIVPVGDDRSRLYELRVGVPPAAWPAGQTLRVAIPSAARQRVVAVPRDALVLRREGSTVFRIDADGKAQAVRVQIGIAAGDLIEVSGIAAGERVVIRGGERLRPGQSVQIIEREGGS